MAITTQILLETEKRFQEREKIHEKREPLLKKVRWHTNMDTQERVHNLQELNSKEQAEKRMKRLKSIAVKQFALSNESEVFAEKDNFLDDVVFERILGQSDLMNINFLEKGICVSRTVGRVVIKNSLGSSVGYGTGFLVSPRLLMTNNHVIRDYKEAALSHVEFNYQTGSDGDILTTERFSLDPSLFFFTNRELDFTVVAVHTQSKKGVPLKEYGWNKLIEQEGKIMIGEYMNIIQHPAGRPKEMALRSNMLTDILEHHVHYKTDTEPGSSGSPVFNDQWEIVALHHSTVPRRDKFGNILTVDNKIWKPSMGETSIAWIANEGVRISRIVKMLKSISSNGITRNLRNAIFDGIPPTFTDLFGKNGHSTNGENGKAHEVQDRYGITVSQEEDGAVWTVPVRIKLQVGNQLPVLKKNGATISQVDVVDDVDAATGVQVKGSTILQKELEEAKRELEAAKSKKYYNASEDKKSIKDYYVGLNTSSMSKKKLYEALNRLVTETHTEEIPYRPSMHLYSWVDLQPNLKLRSIYSAKEFDPAKVIEEDFRQEARIIEYAESLIRESTLSDRELAEKIALFEAAAPFNCEHVVPQSWFAKAEPMRGDLHHLFTCEWGCNSFRGNTPYFDFDDYEEAIRTECGKREGNKFEPEAGKGEVARAVLYFLLRYPGEINKTSSEYTTDRISILLDWHESNKVTLHEKHRNAAIYKRQGNRNPLIDKPQLARKIDFLQGLG